MCDVCVCMCVYACVRGSAPLPLSPSLILRLQQERDKLELALKVTRVIKHQQQTKQTPDVGFDIADIVNEVQQQVAVQVMHALCLATVFNVA